MSERILVISNEAADIQLIKQAMVPQGFAIDTASLNKSGKLEADMDDFAIILADYDTIGKHAQEIVKTIQKNRSKTCFILYGDEIETAEVSDLLQNGIYGFVPRRQLAGRVAAMVVSGLENRQSFIEILDMIDALKDANQRLEAAKAHRQDLNRQLAFINRLSDGLSRDQNWGRIIPYLLEAGFLNVCDTALLSILYRLGGKWHLAMHLSKATISKSAIERYKKDMAAQFSADKGKLIDPKEIVLQLSPFSVKISGPDSIALSKEMQFPLISAGKQIGLLCYQPEVSSFEQNRTLVSIMSNILALSLKNAQIRNRLHRMAITDGLTGLYNVKGLVDTLEYELKRAQRYGQPVALIMIDVDDFNTINDMLGHATGDYVLSEMAGCIRRCARRTDTVARYENDEFAVLMPETNLEKAASFAFRLVRVVKSHDFNWQGADVNVKFSYGIAAIENTDAPGGTVDDMIMMARSKLHGTRSARRKLYPVAGGR